MNQQQSSIYRAPLSDRVAASLRDLMRETQNTTVSLARISGIPQRTVHNILFSGQKISVDALAAMAGAMGSSAVAILSAEEDAQ